MTLYCKKCGAKFFANFYGDEEYNGQELMCHDCEFEEENNLPENHPDRIDDFSDADNGL